MANIIKNDEDKVWVTLSLTLNLGNYESIKLEAGSSETRNPDVEPIEMIEAMTERLQDFMYAKKRELKKQFGKKKRIE